MIEPTDADILLGRGVRINNHPGNEAYREIIHQNAVRKDREREMKFYSLNSIDNAHIMCTSYDCNLCR